MKTFIILFLFSLEVLAVPVFNRNVGKSNDSESVWPDSEGKGVYVSPSRAFYSFLSPMILINIFRNEAVTFSFSVILSSKKEKAKKTTIGILPLTYEEVKFEISEIYKGMIDSIECQKSESYDTTVFSCLMVPQLKYESLLFYIFKSKQHYVGTVSFKIKGAIEKSEGLSEKEIWFKVPVVDYYL